MGHPTLDGLTPAELALAAKLLTLYPLPANFTPPWMLDPNYVAPDMGPAIIIATVVSTIITLLFVCCRVYVRITFPHQKMRWDDYTLIPAMLLSIGLGIVCILMVLKAGAGKHYYDIGFHEIVDGTKIGFAYYVLFNCASSMTRISVLCFVCYLLPSSRSITWIVRFLFAFYISIFIFPIFLDFLKCKPYAASWDVSVQASGAKCLNYITVGLAVSVIYVVADAILVMIPMVVVWNLRIQKRRKVGALSLLAIGMLSCAFCIWKTAYLQSIYATPDVTWGLTHVLILSELEINLAIITTSLPVVKILTKRLVELTLTCKGRTTTSSLTKSDMGQGGLSRGSKLNTVLSQSNGSHRAGSDDVDDIHLEFLTDEKLGQPQPASMPLTSETNQSGVRDDSQNTKILGV